MNPPALARMVALALLVSGATASAQNGGRAPPAPLPMRVVWSDAIVVGKLGKVEEKIVSATPVPGAKVRGNYRVLELKVEEGLRGAKRGDVLRFGFMVPKVDSDGPGPRLDPTEEVIYSPGQECLFFLNKHHEESFYYAPYDYPDIDKKERSYVKDLELTRRCVKLWQDPKAGLKAKDAEDRLICAGLLIHQYRHYHPSRQGPEAEPISAEESKLILNILADADWPTKAVPGSSLPLELTPGWLFSQLNVTFKDGWTSPAGGCEGLYAAGKQWVKTHANTYRIQRFVPVAARKSEAGDKKK